jgi:DNA-binding PadR family transcriptional regulator
MKIDQDAAAEVEQAQSPFMPTTTYAVLGLLSFGQELCGYELRQWALNSLRFFYWTPAQSQIYKELKRLGEAGYIAGRTIAQTDRPAKTVYRITESGTAELRRWLEQAPLGPVVYKHPAALRLFFGHLASPERRREILLEHRRAIDVALAELEASQVALANNADSVMSNLVTDWTLDIYRGDMVGTEKALDRHEK